MGRNVDRPVPADALHPADGARELPTGANACRLADGLDLGESSALTDGGATVKIGMRKYGRAAAAMAGAGIRE